MQKKIATHVVDYYQYRGWLVPDVDVHIDIDYPDLLLVDIYEASVGHLEITPADGRVAKRVRDVATGQSFSSPIRQDEVNTLLTTIDQLRGIWTDARFASRDDGSGVYDLLVDAQPYFSSQLSIGNDGSRLLGREMAYLALTASRPWALPLSIGMYGSDTIQTAGYHSYGMYFTLPVRDKVELFVAWGESHAALRSRDSALFDTDYDREHWQARLTYSRDVGPSAELELYVDYATADYLRDNAVFDELDERLRIVQLGAAFSRIDAALEWWLRIDGSRGINDFGARREEFSLFALDSDIDLDFAHINIAYTAWFSMPLALVARLDVAAQYSNDVLPSSQTFTLGGSEFARAYEPGEFSGDRGAGGKFELRRGYLSRGDTQLTPYTYYGIGTVSSASRFGADEVSASSAGIGLRLTTPSVYAYVEIDWPLSNGSIYRQDQERVTAQVRLSY